MAKKAKKAKKSKQTAKKKATKPVKKVAPKKATPKAKKAAPVFGLLSVTPGFTANDAAASMQWYCDVLGFSIAEKWEIDGVSYGGRVQREQVSINIGQDDWKMGRDRAKGTASRMYIMTGPGIDDYAAAIKARGGVLDGDVVQDWGVRAFSINDPDGFKLTFMTPVK